MLDTPEVVVEMLSTEMSRACLVAEANAGQAAEAMDAREASASGMLSGTAHVLICYVLWGLMSSALILESCQ